jgi:putative sigma-54 modulation protein
MKIDIVTRGVDIDADTRRYIERRIGFALGRFADRVPRTKITLEDQNGPRGGLDTMCRVIAEISRAENATVVSMDIGARAAVDRAADRIQRAVLRRLDHARARRSNDTDG